MDPASCKTLISCSNLGDYLNQEPISPETKLKELVFVIRTMNASCSRKKHQKDAFEFLPEHTVFHILLLLPAKFLNNYARYVCKAWSTIISDPVFINQHYNRSNSGLIYQNYDIPIYANYLVLRERCFEVHRINDVNSGRLISSSKGISLFYTPLKPLYVKNLTTRKSASLPSPLSRNERFLGCHITFVPQISQYKVVYCVSFCKARKWHVWTLGKDQSWRNLEITGINLDNKLETISASAGGVIYLSQGRGAISVIDLNVETGYSVQVPDEFSEKLYWLHEMGNNISLGVNIKGEIHIYILKNLITSEWCKVYKLRDVMDKRIFLFRTIVPVGWLRNNEKFVFIIRKPGYWIDRYIVAYDVKTGETVIHKDSTHGKIYIHTNSLISW